MGSYQGIEEAIPRLNAKRLHDQGKIRRATLELRLCDEQGRHLGPTIRMKNDHWKTCLDTFLPIAEKPPR